MKRYLCFGALGDFQADFDELSTAVAYIDRRLSIDRDAPGYELWDCQTREVRGFWQGSGGPVDLRVIPDMDMEAD